MNKPVGSDKLAIDLMRELPLGTRYHGPLRLTRVPDGEHIARVFRKSNRVLHSAEVSLHQVAQGDLRGLGRKHQVAAQQAGDGLSIFLSDRGKESQLPWSLRIPLPPEAHDS